MEGGDYARIFSLSLRPFSDSLSMSYLSLCLFAKTVISASNKHSELAEKRSSNEWQCALLPRLLSSHLHLSLRRLENQ